MVPHCFFGHINQQWSSRQLRSFTQRLRTLRNVNLSQQCLVCFYHYFIDNILTYSILVLYDNRSEPDNKTVLLQNLYYVQLLNMLKIIIYKCYLSVSCMYLNIRWIVSFKMIFSIPCELIVLFN